MHCLSLIAVVCVSSAPEHLPPDSLDLELSAPIASWDEGIPLGNGLLGGLLWGEGSTVRLSLDRGDLWDSRMPERLKQDDWTWKTVQRLVEQGDLGEVFRIFAEPYAIPYPTKIGAGRLEMDLEAAQTVEEFSLHLATAEGRVALSTGDEVRAFYSAAEPVALLLVPGPAPAEIRVLPPSAVDLLGYPAADIGASDGETWYVQEASEGLTYVGFAAWRRVGESTLLAVTVATTTDGPNPLAIARQRATHALDRGYERMLDPHAEWWAGFWQASGVDIPDEALLRHYYLVRYFHGAASRQGAPPMPLQGVWTADDGTLPPWKGDYHHNLNTQMTYSAYLTAGHFDEGRAFLDFMWDLLPRFREFAERFYGVEGAVVPAVMGLRGQPLGGIAEATVQPTDSAWLGWMFYSHWLYTQDDEFLEDRAYPWCAEIAEGLLGLLTPGPDGIARLPLSSSPEIANSKHSPWFEPNTTYDQTCMRALFLALAHMASELGRPDEEARWRTADESLGDYLTEPDGALMLGPGEEFLESHRHHSHSMAIHPFGLINTDQGAESQAIVDATLRRYEELGSSLWCGFSFSWMACTRARAGDGDGALRYLDMYRDSFTLRNGFHVNGDQSGKGYSDLTYRPFTLEGNFLACQAVQEMLLQSWSPSPGSGEPGVIRVFPAMPWSWHEASFDDLRAEGGHRVSARRENNATTWLRVVAGSGGEVRIRDNFGGRTPAWSRAGVRKEGRDFVIDLHEGDVLEARIARPRSVAPPPEDVAEASGGG